MPAKANTDYLSAHALLAAHADAAALADCNRDARRSLFCTCGWGALAPSLHAANTRVAMHLVEATEACDHTINIEDVTP